MSHWLTKKVKDLPETERRKVVTEIIADAAALPTTGSDKYRVGLMADYNDQAIEHFQNYGKMQGLSSGYPSVDRLTKGLVGGELIVVAGKTSHGKTTFAANVASHVAAAGTSVLFVTMEMTHPELTSRYMHLNGGLTEQYHQVAALTLFQQNDELNWQDIDGLMENAVVQMGVGLVVIDHLHYFTRELQNVAEDLGRITKELKKNAIRHNVPVMLISHVRKGKDDLPATIEDLRGSSYIGQDADIVLMVGRNPESPAEFGVKIEKNRNRGYDSQHDTVLLDFDQTRITEQVRSSLGGR
jgi:replicative DNA helicase